MTKVHQITEAKQTRPANASKPWPSQDKIRRLEDFLDDLGPILRDMRQSLRDLREANKWDREYKIKAAQKSLDRFEVRGLGNLNSDTIDTRIEECTPETWWNDSGDVAYSEVAKMIGGLMGSFPTSKIPDPEIFVRVLIDDVMAEEPGFLQLESVCRHLRKTQKFMPTISEVLEALDESSNLWSKRCEQTCGVERTYNDLKAELAKAREQLAIELKEAEEAGLMPIGARVSHPKFGAGTVEYVEENKITVRFDKLGDTRRVVDSFLTKVTPADEAKASAPPCLDQ